MNGVVTMGIDNQNHKHPLKIDTHGHLQVVKDEESKITTGPTSIFNSSVGSYVTSYTSNIDMSNAKHVIIYGSTSNTSGMGTNKIEISPDGITWYDSQYTLWPNFTTGQMSQTMTNVIMPYMRVSIENQDSISHSYNFSFMTLQF